MAERQITDLEVLLWRATVSVETATDATPLGTGFWVTPTRVLTCAHVVAAAHGAPLQVRAWGRVLPVASHDPRPPGGPEDNYPFPDLALLAIDQPPPHPCVLLDPDVRADDRLYAASFTDARPQGEPITGDCEGRAPDPEAWIKFRLTNVRPGASGSAVLNIRTGGICGVLKRSRDTGDDKGGWASPVDAIAAHWPTLIGDNAAHHAADPTWRHAVQARLGTPTPTTEASAETHVSRVLRITQTDVVLQGGPQTASHTPAGLTHADGERLWDLERARRRGLTQLPERLLEVGATLARAYLDGAAGEALAQAVSQAEGRGQVLRLGLSISPDLADLPWEALRLPGGAPLALHRSVELYRTADDKAPNPQPHGTQENQCRTTASFIPPPLRILAVIASPDADDERGELLDAEAELARILDAVEPARHQGRANVRILNRGTRHAIREALKAERYHVLHLSCHAGPGVLMLEDDEGGPQPTTATELLEEAIPAGRQPPLVVLSGCSTALGERNQATQAKKEPKEEGANQGEAALPAIARELLANGVRAVVAMGAPVSDYYATGLCARMYRELAEAPSPNPLTALSEARRLLEHDRRAEPPESPLSALAEWATPSLLVKDTSGLLYDPGTPAESLSEPAPPTLDPGVVVRAVGDFVGRRRDLRTCLKALRQSPGVVLTGLGGVGKSTLAAQLVSESSPECFAVASLAGTAPPEAILERIAQRLVVACLREDYPEAHPLRLLAQQLRDRSLDWATRLELLQTRLLIQKVVLLLLDNFEDNLTEEGGGRHGIKDPALADFLAAWTRSSGTGRLLVTSRHPFALPDGAEDDLLTHPVGPLSWPETRKLIWRLPGLEALLPTEQRRAYEVVGGHPRTLEYLDALLRGGTARFPDIARRMDKALKKQGIEDPAAWTKHHTGDLSASLATAVTLAVDDVVLEDLLSQADQVPLAKQLLLGTSVYRIPVDEVGLAWHIAEEVPIPEDPERAERLDRWNKAAAARGEDRSTDPADLGYSPEEIAQLQTDLEEVSRPPLLLPGGPQPFRLAVRILEDLGLLARIPRSDGRHRWLVHRWTAEALAGLEPDVVAAAHPRAASHWEWRVRVAPQSPEDTLEQLIEGRQHRHAAGEEDRATRLTLDAASRLHTWGLYAWEEHLCTEALAWVPQRSWEAGALSHRLGMVAQSRGDYDAALDWYRRCLEISEELGDRAGMAITYHQLGMVAQDRGDYDAALGRYRRCLEISEELGDRSGMASSYGQLGNLAYLRGDYDAALGWYRRCLEIFEELGDRAGMAITYHQLGMVAQDRGDYDAALGRYRRSLQIEEELGDRSGMASSYGQLGNLAYLRGDYDAALDWYRRCLEIFEELGDRAGLAITHHQLGMVAQDRGDYDAALGRYRRSLEIKEELGDRSGMANSYGQLGMVAQDRGDYDAALGWYRRGLEIFEELGDRTGMASTLSQIGVLLTETNKPAKAVPYNVRSLFIRLELQVPQASIDIHWLGRQRGALGDEAFRKCLLDVPGMDEAAAEAILNLLDND